MNLQHDLSTLERNWENINLMKYHNSSAEKHPLCLQPPLTLLQLQTFSRVGKELINSAGL